MYVLYSPLKKKKNKTHDNHVHVKMYVYSHTVSPQKPGRYAQRVGIRRPTFPVTRAMTAAATARRRKGGFFHCD